VENEMLRYFICVYAEVDRSKLSTQQGRKGHFQRLYWFNYVIGDAVHKYAFLAEYLVTHMHCAYWRKRHCLSFRIKYRILVL